MFLHFANTDADFLKDVNNDQSNQTHTTTEQHEHQMISPTLYKIFS